MWGIRQKLSLGLGGLLALMLAIGVLSITNLTELGQSVDVILRENYRSVVACEQMKEALEQMDSGAVFTIFGHSGKGREQIVRNRARFQAALAAELDNITLPGEGVAADRLRSLFDQYKARLETLQQEPPGNADFQAVYFGELMPLSASIRKTADEILHMNQENMLAANQRARNQSASARRQMYVFLAVGTCVALAFVLLTGRWVLRPIKRLIESANEIRAGHLDLVLGSGSRDEIGRLSVAFNEMAASLRESRRSHGAKLRRIERSTREAFDVMPEAVALVDAEGRVEAASRVAEVFGLRRDALARDLPHEWLRETVSRALAGGHGAGDPADQGVIQFFVKGEERFFRPRAVPVLDAEKHPDGVLLVIEDVTQLRQQDEIKRGLVSTVSHQLRTPLTSIRMAVHLLLEEKAGPLTEKQADLLGAAREESERLNLIIENLLDIGRLRSGKSPMDCRAVLPEMLVMESLEPFRSAAADRNVALRTELPADLPEVLADPARVAHVFANLISNALKFTPRGGTVTVSATAEGEDFVAFEVADTGQGIPAAFLERIFEQFFKVPRAQGGATGGAGLGLAISREIVEAHGGTISVKSREGEGTTFRFTLRRADRDLKGEATA